MGQARAGPNAQQLCKNGKRTMFPHEEYCDYYYECVNGEAIVQTCPNGLAFAGQQKGLASNCDYPHRVGCPDGSRVMGRKCSFSSYTSYISINLKLQCFCVSFDVIYVQFEQSTFVRNMWVIN